MNFWTWFCENLKVSQKVNITCILNSYHKCKQNNVPLLLDPPFWPIIPTPNFCIIQIVSISFSLYRESWFGTFFVSLPLFHYPCFITLVSPSSFHSPCFCTVVWTFIWTIYSVPLFLALRTLLFVPYISFRLFVTNFMFRVICTLILSPSFVTRHLKHLLSVTKFWSFYSRFLLCVTYIRDRYVCYP